MTPRREEFAECVGNENREATISKIDGLKPAGEGAEDSADAVRAFHCPGVVAGR